MKKEKKLSFNGFTLSRFNSKRNIFSSKNSKVLFSYFNSQMFKIFPCNSIKNNSISKGLSVQILIRFKTSFKIFQSLKIRNSEQLNYSKLQ